MLFFYKIQIAMQLNHLRTNAIIKNKQTNRQNPWNLGLRYGRTMNLTTYHNLKRAGKSLSSFATLKQFPHLLCHSPWKIPIRHIVVNFYGLSDNREKCSLLERALNLESAIFLWTSLTPLTLLLQSWEKNIFLKELVCEN